MADARYPRPVAASTPAARARYPVVVLLHGGPGSNHDWVARRHAPATLDRLIAAGRIPECIALIPDGIGPGRKGRSLWLDSPDGRSRVESFVLHDLLAWADRRLRTRAGAAGRAVAGVSDGGGAAVDLAFRHPEVFGACASLSGEFRLAREPGMEPVLGRGARADSVARAHSPLLYAARVAPRLAGMRIVLDCGVFDTPLAGTLAMHRRLDALGVPHRLRLRLGSHDWSTWRRAFPDALPDLLAPPRRG